MASLTCSECGKEIEDGAATCPHCGSPVKAKVSEAVAVVKFSGYVPMQKFIFLDIATFGFYSLVWMYRQWKLVREQDTKKISPLWRTVFSGLWSGSLAKNLKKIAEAKGIAVSYNYVLIWFVYLALSLAWKLPDPYWLISTFTFVPLLPMVAVMNKYYKQANPDLPERELSWWRILLAVLGLILVVLSAISAFYPGLFE